MKKSLFALAAMATLGIFAYGCGDDDSVCDDVVCDTVGTVCRVQNLPILGNTGVCAPSDETCKAQFPDGDGYFNEVDWTCKDRSAEHHGTNENGCQSNDDCTEAPYLRCNTQTGECEEEVGEEYRYVRIDDLSPAEPSTTTKEDPGVDIDAVVLVKRDGTKFNIKAVQGYSRSDGGSAKPEDAAHAYDPAAIIGDPDSIVNYTDPDGKCNYMNNDKTKFTFVSLGGLGGYIIGEMGGAIENGDDLYVLEVGDCDLNAATTQSGNSSKAGAENFKVAVSIAKDADSEWKQVINDTAASKGVVHSKISGL
jgi:hypothetical protein